MKIVPNNKFIVKTFSRSSSVSCLEILICSTEVMISVTPVISFILALNFVAFRSFMSLLLGLRLSWFLSRKPGLHYTRHISGWNTFLKSTVVMWTLLMCRETNGTWYPRTVVTTSLAMVILLIYLRCFKKTWMTAVGFRFIYLGTALIVLLAVKHINCGAL